MRNPVDLQIGQSLRHRRWLRGMTQQQLGDAVGIRFQQVQKYESGANRISASRLWVIARAFDADVSVFFGVLINPNSPRNDDGGDGAMQQRQTIDLVRAYYAMDAGPRRALLALAVAMSKQESPDIEATDQPPAHF